MPDTKITALAAITTVDPAADVLPIVDISDTSMAASGTTKKITSNQILGAGGTATLASATITGDLTVRTTGLVVNATGTGVQVSPSAPLCVKTRNSDSVGLRVLQSTSGTSGIQFTDDPVTADWGSILATSANLFVRSNSLLQLQTGGATERLAISSTGVCTWSNVGGVAGTAMTLNSTGLGVGASPLGTAAGRGNVTINGSTDAILALGNAGVLTGYVAQSTSGMDIVGVGATFVRIQTNGSARLLVDSAGNLIPTLQATAPSLGLNSQMVFNLTSNTNLRISVRGTDGTTRTADLTLA